MVFSDGRQRRQLFFANRITKLPNHQTDRKQQLEKTVRLMCDISADKNDRLMGNMPAEKRKKGNGEFFTEPL